MKTKSSMKKDSKEKELQEKALKEKEIELKSKNDQLEAQYISDETKQHFDKSIDHGASSAGHTLKAAGPTVATVVNVVTENYPGAIGSGAMALKDLIPGKIDELKAKKEVAQGVVSFIKDTKDLDLNEKGKALGELIDHESSTISNSIQNKMPSKDTVTSSFEQANKELKKVSKSQQSAEEKTPKIQSNDGPSL